MIQEKHVKSVSMLKLKFQNMRLALFSGPIKMWGWAAFGPRAIVWGLPFYIQSDTHLKN